MRSAPAVFSLLCLVGGACALGAAESTSLMQVGLRASSGTGGALRVEPRGQPVWDAPRRLARGQVVREEKAVPQRLLGGRADPVKRTTRSLSVDASARAALCNASVSLPCKSWLSAFECSTTWNEACPSADGAGSRGGTTLASACPGECPAQVARGNARLAVAPTPRVWNAWSPCDSAAPAEQMPCSFWTQAYSCTTTWSEACPGVNNPAGPQFNGVQIGTACPDLCDAAAPVEAAPAPSAHAPDVPPAVTEQMVFPKLCQPDATCKMWVSAHPSCDVRWAGACPTDEHPMGAAYQHSALRDWCPQECAEKAATISSCSSSDYGATDKGNYDCRLGYALSNYCGFYDDEDFTANTMCCECGGGGVLKESPRGAATEEPGQNVDLNVPPGAAAVLWPVSAGSQRIQVGDASVFASGDMLEIKRGPTSEIFTVWIDPSEPGVLHVKRGLTNSYIIGALVTLQRRAQDVWCSREWAYDCSTWTRAFSCHVSYKDVCPNQDSPYDKSLSGVSMYTMCPRECGMHN